MELAGDIFQIQPRLSRHHKQQYLKIIVHDAVLLSPKGLPTSGGLNESNFNFRAAKI